MNSENKETYTVDIDDAGLRIDAFLVNIYKDLSRSGIQKEIKNGNVTVNQKTVKPSYIIKSDDIVCVSFKFDAKYLPEPENIDLDIVYEDESMLVVNKPSGMLTHPTSNENTGTLVNALLNKYGANLSNINGLNRPGIVHRLDRNTSGLLMVAKNNAAAEYLKEQMQNKDIIKKYYAIVCGNIDTDEGTISADIGRHPTKPQKMAIIIGGKPSITHYKVLERFGSYTFLEIRIETGRTHQIRVHMSHIGHPIVNDTLYGGKKIPVKTDEQALQAFHLEFTSPFDKEHHSITIEPDNAIIKTLNYLRSQR